MLIEAALVLPIMLTLAIGIMEFGLLYSSHSTTTAASRSGARLAATAYPQTGKVSAAQRQTADDVALAVSADLKVLNNAVPIGMTIYRVAPSSPDGAPTGGFPAKGMTGGCSSNCFRYEWNPATKLMEYKSGSWPNPQVCVANQIESVGVFVETRHDTITGLIGTDRHVKAHTVMRLEPVPSDMCT